MHAFIKSTFWTDQRVGELPPEEKLALLWLITNRERDICGFCKPVKRTFEFETGIPFEALGRGCHALPASFYLLPCGTFLIRNFVRHQFSKAGVVSTKNKVVIAVVRHAQALPIPLRAAFYEAYPELAELANLLPENAAKKEGDAIPMPWGKDKSKDKSKEEEGCGEKPTAAPPLAVTAEAIVGAYPRRESTAECLTIVGKQLGDGEDAEAMIAGTRAIAAAMAQWPAGQLNRYGLSAPKFFRDKRWQDDPATWLRQATTAGTTSDGAKLELGGRRPASVTKIPFKSSHA